MKKKLLLFVLTFAMVLPLFSGMVFSAAAATDEAKNERTQVISSLADAVANAQAGDTITLQKDVTLPELIAISKNLTIDGNGNTITYTGAVFAFNPRDAATVTFKNMTIISPNG